MEWTYLNCPILKECSPEVDERRKNSNRWLSHFRRWRDTKPKRNLLICVIFLRMTAKISSQLAISDVFLSRCLPIAFTLNYNIVKFCLRLGKNFQKSEMFVWSRLPKRPKWLEWPELPKWPNWPELLKWSKWSKWPDWPKWLKWPKWSKWPEWPKWQKGQNDQNGQNGQNGQIDQNGQNG